MVAVSLQWQIVGFGLDVVRTQPAHLALWDYNWPLFWQKRAWRVGLALVRQQFAGLYTLRIGPIEIATWQLNSEGVKRMAENAQEGERT